MPPRTIAHLTLIAPVIFSVFMVVSGFKGAQETPFGSGVTVDLGAFAGKLFKGRPYEMPGDYSEIELPETIAEASPEISAFLGETNSLLIFCSALLFAGVFGTGLVVAGKVDFEPWYFAPLRAATLPGIVGGIFFLIGYGLAYPGDFNGVLGTPYFYLPGGSDPIEFGMMGMTEWTDILYQGAYVVFFGALILGSCAARQNAATALIIATGSAPIFVPIAISWKWGAGWLDHMGSYDFAGSALIHWHVGVVALGVGGLLRLFRRPFGDHDQPSPIRFRFWLPGMLLYIAALCGMNFGSPLEASVGVVGAVIKASLLAAVVSAAIAGAVGCLLKTRPLIEWVGLGLVAGLVVVSGGADLLTSAETIVLGVIAGLLVPLFVWLGDRYFLSDPLGIAGVHGLAGAIGTLAVPFLGADDFSNLPAQIAMLAAVPILSLGLAIFVVAIAGLLRGLFVDRLSRDKTVEPPPLPMAR